jgi:hypothetical protein
VLVADLGLDFLERIAVDYALVAHRPRVRHSDFWNGDPVAWRRDGLGRGEQRERQEKEGEEVHAEVKSVGSHRGENEWTSPEVQSKTTVGEFRHAADLWQQIPDAV